MEAILKLLFLRLIQSTRSTILDLDHYIQSEHIEHLGPTCLSVIFILYARPNVPSRAKLHSLLQTKFAPVPEEVLVRSVHIRILRY